MKITFLGAAGEVTGSQHLVETGNLRVLLDCGLFQGHRAEARKKNETFACDPKNLDGVILSHAHIDHCGNLPGLYRAGFRGPIFCTPATAEVAEVMLLDSAHIQEEDARYLRKHQARGSAVVRPLYEEEDAREVTELFETCDYHEWHDLSPEFRLKFSDAGHILGSSIVEMDIKDKGDVRRVVFTGDLGRRGLPLLRDPEPVEGCEVLISESTYGNRVHPPPEDLKAALLGLIVEAYHLGGRVIVPAFSLGRTQQLVYYLNELDRAGHLPDIPVYVDSPLSLKLTDVYRRHQHIMDASVQRALGKDDDLFEFRNLVYIESPQESARLNHRKEPFVVISASGMCESGRILHHLKHAVSDPRNTIVIIGFQAQHTLGRRIVERAPTVKIFDRIFPLKARVVTLNGLSAHADAADFKWWYEQLASRGGIGQPFLVHGEPEASKVLAAAVRDFCDEDPIIPARGESFDV